MNTEICRAFKDRSILGLFGALLGVAISSSVAAAEPAQDPLFMTQPVRPITMLNMSNDHQLFFKLYDDYSDLDDDGELETTYEHDEEYYGYFDEDKCYVYTNNRFEPSGWESNSGYCNAGGVTNEWSGNFLNWATMTRIDAVRKILYGGMRSTDTATITVLERALLPNDAHSFTKYYNGTDISRLTPYNLDASKVGQKETADTGITICNTTDPSDRGQLSQNVDAPPLMRVAQGNFSLWASNERWQCLWGEASNGNDPEKTGIYAYSYSPDKATAALGQGDYNVRILSCDKDWVNDDNNESCQAYGSSLKPVGLLQEFGENGSISFGLMTGSYDQNKSGGVLRKNVGNINDEINSADGTFVVPADADSFNGIIQTLNKLRIYGYRFDNGTYHGTTGSDNCIWGLSSFDDGECTNWGNPQSEIYLESLRYLAGLDPTGVFLADDSDRIAGLNTATWSAPVTNRNYCAPINVLQFNASTSSYDWDQLSGASDIGLADLDAATDAVGAAEGIHGNQYFVGEIAGATGDQANQLCTEKTVDNLSDARGTCPDAPRLEGSYQIAGLAHYARTTGIPLTGVTAEDRQTVKTFGVTLSPAVPSVTIPVPGDEGKTVSIQPACRDVSISPQGNCAIVDFKVIDQQETTVNVQGLAVLARTGSLYVNWEDSEQGGDFDQDMWGIMDYVVTADKVAVTTQLIAQSASGEMGFGYVIGGTSQDGFKVHSGINDFIYGDYCLADGDCTCHESPGTRTCNLSDPTTQVYDVDDSSADPLRQPLFYAAKWGGYSDSDATDDEIAAITEPESYFEVRRPRRLQQVLRNTFERIAAGIGAASSVATNSTRLTEGSYVYQALFNSEGWSGTIRSFLIGKNGDVSDTPTASTDVAMQASEDGRTIYTYSSANGDSMVPFEWANLSDAQKNYLMDGGSAADGQQRLRWIAGDDSAEGKGLRERDKLLGDVVNSSPVYLGQRDYGYSLLPADLGGDEYADFVENKPTVPTLFVGANDGMLHAFYAEGANALSERFAYVPNGVYPKLAKLTDPNYGRSDVSHEYTVDGPLSVGDAYLNGTWKSVLVGTFGAGGKGVFALDVTNPDSPKLLFELAPDDLNAKGDLGYVLSQPMISRMPNGRWAAVFGNGYDAGTSQLFIVDLAAPRSDYTRVLDTGAGTGLSGVSILPDAFGKVKKAYAGDLKGNLWVFDLVSDNASQWSVGLSGKPLFVARDADGDLQPISSTPTLGYNPNKTYDGEDLRGVTMVYFGTGKYFEDEDNGIVPGSAVNSFYGIADIGEPLTYQSSNGSDGRTGILHDKTIVQGVGTRTINGEDAGEPDWSDPTVNGWFIDFNTRLGERVVSKPLLLFDRIIFPTLIPSDVPCNFGGRSWLMQLEAIGDRYTEQKLLEDVREYDSLILGNTTYGVVGQGKGKLLFNTSDAGVEDDDDKATISERDLLIPTSGLGRQSWRQLK